MILPKLPYSMTVMACYQVGSETVVIGQDANGQTAVCKWNGSDASYGEIKIYKTVKYEVTK